MSNTLPALMRYFRACYQADFRATRLLHFLSKKAALPYLFADEAFLSGELLTLPVPTEWGEAMQAHLFLHGKEQQLYCHAFFLTGRTQILGKRKAVCAPLFLIPAALKLQADVYQVELDFGSTVINPAFTEVLQGAEGMGRAGDNLHELLNAQLPLPPFGFDQLHQIEDTLCTYLPGVFHPDYHSFPLATDKVDLQHGVRQQTEGYAIWPCCGLATLEKSTGALGILHELDLLSKQHRFSPVLHALFTNNQLPVSKAPEEIAPLPVLLSANQEAILQAAATQTLSMVNGPPGTGKSFTIAAIAADRLSKGESVLIAARNEQAVNVIADKLERDFQLPDIAIRASRRDYRRHLRRRIKDWLNGLGTKFVSGYIIRQNRINLETYNKQAKQLETKLWEQIERDLSNRNLLATSRPNLWQRWKLWRLQKLILKNDPVWEDQQQLDYQRDLLQRTGQQHLENTFFRRLNHAFRVNRPELQKVWEALRSQTGKQKERYFQQVDFPKLLQAMPVWLVDTAHVHEVLPLQEKLFDLVIIDEASQCDIASALPLLQRAKRAVIVGDPKQLRHVSFLSRARQRNLADQFKLAPRLKAEVSSTLSYRDSSLLDLASARIRNQRNVILLDEHFRSLPELIRFSNRQFYRSQLKIMTAAPSVENERCIFIHRTNGERDIKGHNEKEAAAIIRNIQKIIEVEESLSHDLCQSIGVLSPFRAQVEHLRRLFKTTFTAAQLTRHQILLGTAHDFQGEERDLMLISWVVDANTPTGALRYFQREDVFNVSITRARVAQYLFVSLDLADLPADQLLAQYLVDAGMEQEATVPSSRPILNDRFLNEVRTFLQLQGVTTFFENYHIAGLEIDLVFVHNQQTYCIDLIGYPGPYEEALPSSRWKMLGRLGLHPFSLPYSHWLFRREESEKALKRFIGQANNQQKTA